MNSILRPSIPPLAFSAAKRALAPERDARVRRRRAAERVRAAELDRRVGDARRRRRAFTSTACRHRPPHRARTRSPAAGRSSAVIVDNHRMLPPFRLRPHPRAEAAQQADHSCRQHVHEQDQDRAVDHGRERLVDIRGVDRHELDEQRAEHRAADGRQAADDDCGQERERQREAERFRRDEADRDREHRPADAGVRGAERERACLVGGEVDAERLGGDLVVTDRDQRAADAPAHHPGGEQEHRDRDREAQQIQPLVVGQKARPAGDHGCRRGQTLRAAGEPVEALDQLRRRHRQSERHQREVEAAQAQRRDPEREAGGEADRGCHRDRRQMRPARLRHQDRRHVGAEREERAVAERDLPAVADQQVEPERGDGVGQHERELRHAVRAEEERQRDGGHEHGDPDGPLGVHARATSGEPNSPCGRTSSTVRITISGTRIFRSWPMKST